jgi:hypothetical protein
LGGRRRDEMFPLEFDLPGDETIGPGGLASAIRGATVVRSSVAATARRAPSAWFIQLTNPMSILLAALGDPSRRSRVRIVRTSGRDPATRFIRPRRREVVDRLRLCGSEPSGLVLSLGVPRARLAPLSFRRPRFGERRRFLSSVDATNAGIRRTTVALFGTRTRSSKRDSSSAVEGGLVPTNWPP